MALETLELDIALQPKQKAFLRALETTRETLFGGARGGGKSRGLRDVFLIRRVKMPYSKGQIWRRTYHELERNHIRPMFENHPALREYYNESKHLLTLPNGSTQEFCYAQTRADLKKVQGAEADDIGVEEAGDWFEDEYETLLATNRSTRYDPRAALTANPGGRGHSWLKRRFVDSKVPGRTFIQSLVTDNAALMRTPDYIAQLDAIKNPQIKRAWRFGDWDVALGTFFEEFSRKVHVVAPFKIPGHWKWFGSYDYGFGHPCVWLLGCTDEQGTVYVTDELYEAKLYLEDQAARVNQMIDARIASGELSNRNIIFDAGRDCWATKRAITKDARDTTIAEDFMNPAIVGKPHLRLNLRPANVARRLGAKQFRQYLHYEHDPNGVQLGPKVKFFDTCELTIQCIERMVHAENDAEDVEKVDSVNGDPLTGDDGYDGARYLIASRPPVALRPKTLQSDRYRVKRDTELPWHLR